MSLQPVTNSSPLPVELVLSNMEVIAKLKLHDYISCSAETGKIWLDTRRVGFSQFNLKVLEGTCISVLPYLAKSSQSEEANRIKSLWQQFLAGMETLEKTYLWARDSTTANNINELITKSKIPPPPPPPDFSKMTKKKEGVKKIITGLDPKIPKIAIDEKILSEVKLRETPKIQRAEEKPTLTDAEIMQRQILKKQAAVRRGESTFDFDQNGSWDVDPEKQETPKGEQGNGAQS